MKKLIAAVLCLAVLSGLFPLRAMAAPAWPENISIEAEGGIVMDADTGTVLYGKNIHSAYYPASITKILTALIVLENCSLDEMVTFSHNAVYNVESGSSSAGLDEGDVISVRDCLYAMLLKSANEAANALAEHVAGTTEAFAEMMNEKAASLGCQDSHFANPSGLNDPEHYTSAYDMALIGQAALKNKTFMEIDSTLYYDLPVTKRNPEGGRIYPGHKMLKKNLAEYYPGCLGGKTGYTSLAGNTLVTFAQRDGLTLVAVILNGHLTHYTDTKALLDFGFQNFQSIAADSIGTRYTSLDNDMTIAGLSPTGLSGLKISKDQKVTVPKNTDLSGVTSSISYDLGEDAPDHALAEIRYFWDDRQIGTAYLSLETTDLPRTASPLSSAPASSVSEESDGLPAQSLPSQSSLTQSSPTQSSLTGNSRSQDSPSDGSRPLISSSDDDTAVSPSGPVIPGALWIALGVILVLAALAGGFLLLRMYVEKKEEEARYERRKKRLERLEQSGISSAEFDLMMEKRRNSSSRKQKNGTASSNKRNHDT